ncbi:MAG: hypothetical protein ACKO7G_02605, partial [Gammaproteobacteria bacterium]
MTPRTPAPARRLPALASGLMGLLLGITAASAQSPSVRPPAQPAASGTYSVEVIVFRNSGGGDGGTAAAPRGGSDNSGGTRGSRHISPPPVS